MLVHAIDEEAKEFYRHFDFEDSPVNDLYLNDLYLMMLMQDVEAALRG